MEVTKQVYLITAGLLADERFGLVAQMRRCAVSILSNIAEGAARSSDKEFLTFFHFSLASLSELDTQLELSNEFGFIDPDTWRHIDEMLTEEDRLLNDLIKSIIRKSGEQDVKKRVRSINFLLSPNF